MFRPLLSALFTLSLSAEVFSQVPVFRNFSVKDGLPSRETYGVFQDSKGYIWICTDAGIARYNASEFTVFNSSSGLPDNTIFEVKEDKQGRIWFRSFSGYIGYVQNDSVKMIPAAPRILEFQKKGIICSFAIDSSGVLYLGRQGPETVSFLQVSPPYGPDDAHEFMKDTSTRFNCTICFIDAHNYVFSECRPPLLRAPVRVQEYMIFIGDKKGIGTRTAIAVAEVNPLIRVFTRGAGVYI
jgi:ligand-binding sensor domain-containing protein